MQVRVRGHEGCCTYSLPLIYSLNQTDSVIFMYFSCDPRDHFISRFLYFATTGFKCCDTAEKKLLREVNFSVVIFFWSLPALLSVENWWGMLHLFIIPYVQTQWNRVCNFHVILLWLMLPKNHHVSIFILNKNRCQVLCGSCKNLPLTSFQCCYNFLVLRDHWW
jgi:hypothetical protein